MSMVIFKNETERDQTAIRLETWRVSSAHTIQY